MNIAQSNTVEPQILEVGVRDRSADQKTFATLLSCLPWAIVGCLLWAGIFVKPGAVVEVVVPPAIDKRDKIYGISKVSSDRLWVAGNYGKILRSDDAGLTWEVQTTSTLKHLQDISAWDAKRAVVVGNMGVVLTTADGGVTWTEVESPKSEVANKLIRVHTYEGGEAWAVGEMGMIIYSADYGNSWVRMREEEDVIMNDLIKVGENKILVVGEYGRLFSSVDNGTTWQDSFTNSSGSLMAIEFRTPKDGVIVGLDGAILGTGDGGKSWSLVESEVSGNAEHLMDVQWSAEINKWVAVGNKGKIVKFSVDLKDFAAGTLANNDLSSHTEVAVVTNGVVVVGENVGYFDFESSRYKTLGN